MSILNTEDLLLVDVGLYYAKIKSPSKKFESDNEYEYVVDVHIDKETAKAWKKEFPKQKPKEVEYEEFVEKFGAENAIGTDEQYFIKLKKPATYRNKDTGEIVPVSDKFRPRVLIDAGDGELEDITFTHLIGNGSKGVVQYEVNTNKFGTFAKLFAIRVDELVEVEESGTGKFNALGKVKSLADNPNNKKPEEKNTSDVQEPSTEGGVSTENTNSDDEDDIPF